MRPRHPCRHAPHTVVAAYIGVSTKGRSGAARVRPRNTPQTFHGPHCVNISPVISNMCVSSRVLEQPSSFSIA
eukprot:6259058-Pyramimonas_sp.AAC.1